MHLTSDFKAVASLFTIPFQNWKKATEKMLVKGLNFFRQVFFVGGSDS